MGKIKFQIVILLILIPLLSFAQKKDLKFDHFNTIQGLSKSNVYCIFQDSRGFIWIGTRDGLNRYDGYKFTIYKNNPEDPNSLSNNNIRQIIEDKDGNLWIGTWGGGLNIFDRKKKYFQAILLIMMIRTACPMTLFIP